MPLVINRPIGPGVLPNRGGQALQLGMITIPYGTHRHVSMDVYRDNKEMLDKLRASGVIRILGLPEGQAPTEQLQSESEQSRLVEQPSVEQPVSQDTEQEEADDEKTATQEEKRSVRRSKRKSHS